VQDNKFPGPDNDNVIRFEPRPLRKSNKKNRQPLINLPPFTKILILILVGIHLGISSLSEPIQYWIIEHFGFIPAYYTGAIPFNWPGLVGPFTFAFIHGGWTHLLMNGIMLVAFGAGLEPWMGWKRMAILMFACSLVAAFVQLGCSLWSNNLTDPVIGASGALSGLFAAAIIMMQERSGGMMPSKYGYWPLIGIWIVTSAVFGMMGGPQGQAIAWPAHIGGFLAGLALLKPVMRLKI
jgi:membrane associated rhomboid family serine protease